ncbi:MAG: hypothetical protein DI598_06160 [Pseudopedobacter saltans]|uniref:Uncharacterized protein n=1 Tax=Pseudopedobacter saltans TaxID=151895 RepID=A0A2W5F1S7_9SPHI|nr:MAG: hypothetical protein DI598_06160 [Pseudopedobacter saltans]
MPTEEQISVIEEKLQALLVRFKRLQKENANLKAELHDASTKLAISLKENESLHQKLDVSNIGVSNWTPAEKQNLQKRIDGYLKDIDKCMELLNA